jgi:tetratricopeptide (TPR) repeat protein
MNFQIERLRLLPQRAGETWQGGPVRMRAWIREKNNKPYRPWMGIWISLKTYKLHFMESQKPQEKDFESALTCLVDFACDSKLAGYRPDRLEVEDAKFAEYLSKTLSGLNITIEKRNKLFIIDEALAKMAEDMEDKPMPPGALETKDVTVDAMRAFAEGACRFYQTKPWEHLTNEDVIEVESPLIESSLRYFSVLGNGGETYGLGFYESLSPFEKFLQGGTEAENLFLSDKHWMILFGPIWEMPFKDADLWEDYCLPVASDDAYPVAMCYTNRGKIRRPGPDILAFIEGLLLALATTDEAQMDSGRWTKVVNTFKGQKEFILSLPYLLESNNTLSQNKPPAAGIRHNLRWMEGMQSDVHRLLEEQDFASEKDMKRFINENITGKKVPHRPPRTSLEQAQDIIYQAFETHGRKQLQLAHKALEICPDCADAYVLMAEQCGDVQKAKGLYEQGILAAERDLGKEFFEKEAGHFWGILKTRPFMRAKMGFAQCLDDLGQLNEAAENYRELLRLNPNDNQAARHFLLCCLLEMNADEKAEDLLKQYKYDNKLAIGAYGKVLLAFRQKGNTAAVRKYLDKALDVNEYVPDYLLGYEDIPPFPQSYSLGSEEEAALCADMLGSAWEKTPGALEWLDSQIYIDDKEEDLR